MAGRRFVVLLPALLAALSITGCSDDDWSGQWAVAEASTPMTGTSRNPLEKSMVGRQVTLSETRVVLPHYTSRTRDMVIPIERVESDPDSAEVTLHPADDARHVDAALIVTPQDDGSLILHGVPADGPTANFFLTLRKGRAE